MTDFLSYKLVQGFMYESGFDVSDPDKAKEFPSAEFMKLASRLVQYGADCELDACCEWIESTSFGQPSVLTESLRTARRPKPPSLAEEALAELNLTADCMGAIVSCAQVELIRRALERLQELEGAERAQ